MLHQGEWKIRLNGKFFGPYESQQAATRIVLAQVGDCLVVRDQSAQQPHYLYVTTGFARISVEDLVRAASLQRVASYKPDAIAR
jgi:hypothetical protein